MDKLGVTAAATGDSSVGDGGRVLSEMNQLNQRYMRLMTELHQRLHQMKNVYDDVGIYFPVCLLLLLLFVPSLWCMCVPSLHCVGYWAV